MCSHHTPPGAPSFFERLTVVEFETRLFPTVAERDSHAFLPLTDRPILQLFEDVLEVLRRADLTAAKSRLARLAELGVHYCLVELVDAYAGPVFGLLEAVVPGMPGYRGWGALLVRPRDTSGRIYQAPHVKADLYTASITLRAFLEDPGAGIALFSGAHRYANGQRPAIADVAHHPENLFHGLTVYLARRGSQGANPSWFIQFHGSRDRPGEPAITASNGAPFPTLTPHSPLVRIGSVVSRAGYLRMGVCGWCDGAKSVTQGRYLLTAHHNIQGRFLDSLGLRDSFMHFEIAYQARFQYYAGRDPGRPGVASLLRAIRQATAPG